MLSKLNYAIIGCGRISRNHIASAIENGLNIVALCDLSYENMIKLHSEFKLSDNVELYVNYQDMLKDKTIDLIAICTDSGSHGKIAINCLNKGINLIIEKPIALSLDEADEIIKISTNQNIKVCACHQNRFNKSIQKIRSAIESKRFGKLMYANANIRWSRGQDYYEQAIWRGTWDSDGGALMNQCIHNIDLLRWMLGNDVVEVFGKTMNFSHDYIETEDFGTAIIKFKNGSYGIVDGSTSIYPKNLEENLYIFGVDGTVKAGGKSVNKIEEWEFKNDNEDAEMIKKEFSENPPNVYGFGHSPLYKDMIEAIIFDRQPYVNAIDGRNALEIVLAIYKSSYEGKPVSLPLYGVSTMDFKK